MSAIETRRLRLPTMAAGFLRTSLQNGRHRAETLSGLELPEDWPDRPGLLEKRLEQLEANPAWEPWLTRLIELRSERRAIGIIGFHGPPGGDGPSEPSAHGVEFGYSVYPPWQRQGYAAEASEALMSWAGRTAGVTRFVLSMAPDNAASVALARRLGFSKVESFRHPVRGLRDVYRLIRREGAPGAV